MKTLNLGSYATNFTSSRQIFIICLAILVGIAPKYAKKYQSDPIMKIIESNSDLSIKEKIKINKKIESIISKLNKYSLPFTYFGFHPNYDGQLGVWIDLGALHKAENLGLLTQISGDSWKGIKSPYILMMKENGIVLFNRRKKRVIWKAV